MKNKGSFIVNIHSVASPVDILDRFVYSLTKAVVAEMTLSTAND